MQGVTKAVARHGNPTYRRCTCLATSGRLLSSNMAVVQPSGIHRDVRSVCFVTRGFGIKAASRMDNFFS